MTIFYDLAIKGINEAIATIDKITDNLKFSELKVDLYSSIIDAVHKISDYYERIKDRQLDADTDLLFRAFAYLNNQIKHDKALEVFYTEVSGSMFPMRFPFRFGPPGLYWKNFENNGRTTSRGKREHYEACLMDKDIKATLCKVKEIIESTKEE